MKTNSKQSKLSLITALLFIGSLSLSCSSEEPVIEEEGETPVEVISLEEQIALLTAATAKYADVQTALDEGFVQQGPYVPNKGLHYMKMSRLDRTFNVEEPEILLYVPDGNGGLDFVAVEFAYTLPSSQPTGFTGDQDVWAQNMMIGPTGAWSLHAWVGVENPNGFFTAANPSIPSTNPATK